jgi:ABC-type uncharacterized transport system permease subunit
VSGLAVAFRRSGLRAPEAAWPALGVALSLLALAPLVALAGGNVAEGYRLLFEASFGSAFGFGVLLTFAVPLILVGLGVAVPYRAGLFNIGGEGQLMLGAFAAVWVGVRLADLQDVPGSFVLPLLAAAASGGLLGAAAGALRAWREINEIVTTIMLSFVAVLFVQYWIAGPFRAPDLSFAASPDIAPGFELPHFGELARVPASIIVALVAAGAVAWWMRCTRAGWRFRLLGLNPRVAERKGVNVARTRFAALAAGGALAGLGGGAEAIGNQLHVGFGFSPGWGFDAVAIALLARGNVFALVPVALYFAFLRNGAGLLQSDLEVPGTVVTMLGGAPVIVVAGIVGWRQYRRTRVGDG